MINAAQIGEVLGVASAILVLIQVFICLPIYIFNKPLAKRIRFSFTLVVSILIALAIKFL